MSVRLYVDEKGSFATSYSDGEHNYGQHTRSMVNIPEICLTYQKYAQHIAKKEKVKYLDKRYQKKKSSYRLSRANGVSHGVLDDLGKTMWHTGSRTTFQMFRLCLMLLMLIDRMMVLPVSEQSNPYEPGIHPCKSTHSLLLLCSSHLCVFFI